jgi:hypothetical protein
MTSIAHRRQLPTSTKGQAMNVQIDSPLDILNAVHEEIAGSAINESDLAAGLLGDCGVDGSGLMPQDMLNALNDNDDARWQEVQSACTACLANYKASCECSNDEFLRSLAAMFIVGNAIRRGHGDWDRSFDFILSVMDANRMKCNVMMRVNTLRDVLRVMRPGGDSKGRADGVV